MKRSFYIGNN